MDKYSFVSSIAMLACIQFVTMTLFTAAIDCHGNFNITEVELRI